MAMFLHLITDEKFIDEVVSRFQEASPEKHEFLFIDPLGKQTAFKHLKNTENIINVQYLSRAYFAYISNLNQYTAVFVHSLINKYFLDFIDRAEKDIVFVWFFWGAELWALKKYKAKAYLPLTKILYYKHRFDKHLKRLEIIFAKYSKMLFSIGLKDTAVTLCRNSIPKMAGAKTNADIEMIKTMRRVNYIVPVVEDDYYVLKKFINCKAERLDWNYSPGLSFEKLGNLSPTGNDLLIGNSGHYTNNHLDIFLKARHFRRCFDKMVVPLSYGNPVYKTSINRLGELFFKNQFYPLNDFLPVQEYFGVISSCRIALFNSRRQQALGNIIVCLFLGIKVFLRKENPIYSFLKKHEVICLSIQDELDHGNLVTDLTREQKQYNRNTMLNLFGKELLLKKTVDIIQTLENRK